MYYYIPIEVKTFSACKDTFKDFIKKIGAKSNTMIFLSEGCYSWLKNNSICFEQKKGKIFKHGTKNNITYIETINIVSSNCSFLKSIICDSYNYNYLNGIPKKIFIVNLENEQLDFFNNISASVIGHPDKALSPVNCIIDSPDLFEDSIVFLNCDSYRRLKNNTSTVSNFQNLERLTWLCDERYPGGDIMLHCLNYGSLYMICSMHFPFFTKDFYFNQAPKAIYFII